MHIKLQLPVERSENTHLLHKGKYHCKADNLFYLFGFSCFYIKLATDLLILSDPIQSNRRSAVQ